MKVVVVANRSPKNLLKIETLKEKPKGTPLKIEAPKVIYLKIDDSKTFYLKIEAPKLFFLKVFYLN